MDKIFYNGVIKTMDYNIKEAQAVVVGNGFITYVGSNDESMQFVTPNTQVIDLNGKLMLPGFNDSHMHLIGCGLMMERLNLQKSKSIRDLIRMGKDFLEKFERQAGFWLQGRGWNNDYWNDKRFPTRYDLDQISLDIPICFIRVCGHMCVLNSKALEIIQITSKTYASGGTIGVDENGIANGILYENAINIAYDKFPKYCIEDIKRMIKNASQLAVSKGITSVQTDDFETLPGKNYELVLDAYTQLIENNQLPIRVNQQCMLPNINELNKFLEGSYTKKYDSKYLKLGPLKLLADGSLGAKTAFLSKPYLGSDSSNIGVNCYMQEELDELIITAHKHNVPCAVHCIGDAAINMVMNSIEKAKLLYPKHDMRHGIVHCQITDMKTLERFKQLDVIAYIQPIFLNYDLHIVEDRVGKELASTSYNFKTMYDKDIKVACGSDAPIENFDVLPNIYCAVTRKDLNGYPQEGWFPEQCLSVDEAIYGFTLGAAFASYDEDIKGSITVGKLADMVVLEDNIYKINKERIKDVQIKMTIVNGEIKYIHN